MKNLLIVALLAATACSTRPERATESPNDAPAPTTAAQTTAPAVADEHHHAMHDAPEQPAETHGDHHAHHHGDDGATATHRFDDVQRWSKVFDDPARDAWQKPAEVIAKMNITPGMTVADIGAGTGYFLGHLAGAVGPTGKVLGLDVEQALVDHMNDRARKSGWTNVEARRIPYDGPGLEPASVDRVLIVNTWHHISDRRAYAAKLLATLRPGGEVHVVDYSPESDFGPDHKLPADKIVAELVAGGFAAALVEETLPHQYIIVARAK